MRIFANLRRPGGIVRPGDRSDKGLPRNLNYFVIDEEKFDHPGDVKLLGSFADPDGRLRRIPFRFHSPRPGDVLEISLTRFAGGRLQCKAEVDVTSGEIVNAVRYNGSASGTSCPGPRCPHFLKRECRLSVRLFFVVPGQRSPNPLCFLSGSWNTAKQMMSAVHNLALQGGLVRPGEEAPFELRKFQARVSRTTPEGKRISVRQWLAGIVCSSGLQNPLQDPSPVGGETEPEEVDPVTGEVVLDAGEVRKRLIELVGEVFASHEEAREWFVSVFGKPAREMNAAEMAAAVAKLEEEKNVLRHLPPTEEIPPEPPEEFVDFPEE